MARGDAGHNGGMRTYLRHINPIVALAVLALCVYAGSTPEEGAFTLKSIMDGGFATYFLAKGLFCSATLFILGQLLLHLMDRGANRT